MVLAELVIILASIITRESDYIVEDFILQFDFDKIEACFELVIECWKVGFPEDKGNIMVVEHSEEAFVDEIDCILEELDNSVTYEIEVFVAVVDSIVADTDYFLYDLKVGKLVDDHYHCIDRRLEVLNSVF